MAVGSALEPKGELSQPVATEKLTVGYPAIRVFSGVCGSQNPRLEPPLAVHLVSFLDRYLNSPRVAAGALLCWQIPNAPGNLIPHSTVLIDNFA